MRKSLIVLSAVLFVYAIISQQLWLTLLVLILSIYLEKQNLFKDWENEKKSKLAKRRT
ncbi:hypothetical protein [Streptococcus dentiloxodontae]